MAIQYNLEPLAAMDIFYGGKTNGVSKSELIKFSKESGYDIPPLLCEFLEKYAYLDVNKGQMSFFRPCDIRLTKVPFEGEYVDVLVAGVSGGELVGLGRHVMEALEQLDDKRQIIGVDLFSDDLKIIYGRVVNGKFFWTNSLNETLSGLFRIMFLTAFKDMDRYIYEGKAIDDVLKTHSAKRSRIMPSEGNVQRHSINYDEDGHTFLVAEFDLFDDECITTLQVIPHIGEKKQFT